MTSSVNCPHCGKKLADENALYQHDKAKHRGTCKPPKVFRQPRDADRSMASELVDAMLDEAMGLPVDDYLLEMFPENFNHG